MAWATINTSTTRIAICGCSAKVIMSVIRPEITGPTMGMNWVSAVKAVSAAECWIPRASSPRKPMPLAIISAQWWNVCSVP